MGGRLDPAVASVRLAVRQSLADVGPGSTVLVAVSGGADSLALAAATAFEAPRSGVRAGAVVVDHGLQPGSGAVARAAAEQARVLGLAPVEVLKVSVGTVGGSEGAARTARYEALHDAARRHGATSVLLAHTLDDQAETVLLGLGRGSGPRAVAAMAPVDGVLRRPLLAIGRTETRRVCDASGLVPWDDPQNSDPVFTRVRVRHGALPALETALGPGVSEALARTADLMRADADALDALAADAHAAASVADGGLDVLRLAALPPALRTRVIRRAALAAGCPASDLAAVHVFAVDRLVTSWHGQERLDLPGGVGVTRTGGTLSFVRAGPSPRPPAVPER